MPAEDADRQEQKDERHAHQRKRLDKAELPSQRLARLHETDGFVSYLCRVTARSGLRCRGKALVFQDRAHPLLIIEIPAHCLTNTLLELVRGKPAQLLLDLRRVYRIPAVVSQAIRDERRSEERRLGK